MTFGRIQLLAGLSALALIGLGACGSAANNAAETTDTAPAESLAPMPTVTPNAAPIESAHPNSIQPETTLSISAEGTVNREPDIAFLNTGVQTQGKTAEEAMGANRSAMNGVFSALKAAKISDKDMQTSNFSLQPQYDYSNRQNGEPPRLTGYTASNQLTVKVRNLANLGETMDALVGAGGNTFSGLSFALEDDRAARNEARDLAMREATSRAELYAKASGYKVARIVTISEGGNFRPQPMAMMSRSMDMAESTPIAGGEVGYSVTVNVVFELRQ
ncbi:MAG: SIMPL domain-containing protein [Henriciella sp.]|nr:SIMPL domain-containing protein [Henriciella sp.]